MGKSASHRITVTRISEKNFRKWIDIYDRISCLFVCLFWQSPFSNPLHTETRFLDRRGNVLHPPLSSTGSHISQSSLPHNCSAHVRITKLNIYLPPAAMWGPEGCLWLIKPNHNSNLSKVPGWTISLASKLTCTSQHPSQIRPVNVCKGCSNAARSLGKDTCIKLVIS